MKKLFAFALLVAIASPAMAAPENSGVCGPDGPEAYKRPGGYCEQIGANHTLTERDEIEVITEPGPV